jgi:HPt (histidine-containing phosphotransfer) domain-containing protein
MSDPLYSQALPDNPEIAELIPQFLRELCEKREQMATALDFGDIDSLRIAAHNYRGSGGSYGFPELSEVAGELEDAAQDGSIDDQVRQAFARFSAVTERLRAGLPVGA